MEELIIVRHGRSLHNMRDTDDLDAGLTMFGKKQSDNVGKFLREEMDLKGYQYFTSPYLRCLETAIRIQPHTMMFNVHPLFCEYLNHFGKECFVKSRRGEFSVGWNEFPDKGMMFHDEFNEVFLHRMHEAYEFLPPKSLVITHGLPALALVMIARGQLHVPIWDHSIDNCSITLIKSGRVVWYGRNLHHELEFDTARHRRDHHVGILKEGIYGESDTVCDTDSGGA